ncbi:MAG: hypothetical protein AAF827_11970 [Cyanobacteria bacterium P01_D01_bin.6]
MATTSSASSIALNLEASQRWMSSHIGETCLRLVPVVVVNPLKWLQQPQSQGRTSGALSGVQSHLAMLRSRP